ncbi:MAG TPA: hypothetical protein VKR26_14120 [Terriglobales bacterium]|nr:hypothetical protein [Terriglobales bacterium]
MIINDLDFMRVAVPPEKADAKLVIDANTVLAPAVTVQRFQTICRKNGQVPELRRTVNHGQLPQGYPAQIRREAPRFAAPPQFLGARISKALNHKPE